MKMTKKSIVLIIFFIVIVSLLVILGLRVKLYKDYLNSLEKIKDFHYEMINYEGDLQENSVIFDQHLFFSLDENYHIWKMSEKTIEYPVKFIDYKFKDEQKFISISASEATIKDLVENFYRDTGLSKEQVKSIIEKHEFTNVLEVFLYAINQHDKKKLSIFSTNEEIEGATFFNSLISQQFVQARFVVDGNSTVKVINGNVNGIEILDGIFQITNGKKSYQIVFVGQHDKEEIERFMKSVHIK